MKKTAMLLILIAIFSKIFGLARDITLAYFYGASNISDAYLISMTIPSIIFGFIGVGISTGYIPMYNKIEGKYGVEEANKYTSNLINILLVICTLIFILGLLFTNQIVKVFAFGFDEDTLKIAVRFTRISLLGIYFTGIMYILKGFLEIKGVFAIPALLGFPLNIIIIISIILSVNTNMIILLAIGSLIATSSQILIMLPFLKKAGYKYKLVLDIKDKHIINMAYIATPLILGLSINQINALVDRTIASQIAVGGISALNYANKLIGFAQGIFVLSIVTVMYPLISKMATENNIKGLKKSVSESISIVNLLIIPITIGAIIFAEPIVRLLFGRGEFDTQAIIMTSNAFFFYSIGLIGFGLREILSRTFYSLQDTKTPMINAAIAMVINLILNLILSRIFGIGGLALATSISAIICSALLFKALRKKIGPFGIKQISISFLKILLASLVMGAIAKIFFEYLKINIFSQSISLIIAIGIGILTYFTIIYFMKIEDMDVIVNAIRRKLKKVEAQ